MIEHDQLPNSIDSKDRRLPRSGQAMDDEGDGAAGVDVQLYPELDNKQRKVAQANLRRYFEIALAIAEGRARPESGLTDPESVPTMKERSNVDLKL